MLRSCEFIAMVFYGSKVARTQSLWKIMKDPQFAIILKDFIGITRLVELAVDSHFERPRDLRLFILQDCSITASFMKFPDMLVSESVGILHLWPELKPGRWAIPHLAKHPSVFAADSTRAGAWSVEFFVPGWRIFCRCRIRCHTYHVGKWWVNDVYKG